jgi:hypothetical protein
MKLLVESLMRRIAWKCSLVDPRIVNKRPQASAVRYFFLFVTLIDEQQPASSPRHYTFRGYV